MGSGKVVRVVGADRFEVICGIIAERLRQSRQARFAGVDADQAQQFLIGATAAGSRTLPGSFTDENVVE
jgi:hypothetical protein